MYGWRGAPNSASASPSSTRKSRLATRCAPAPGSPAAASGPAGEPNDGPAELEIRSGTRADVRVADIVYRLHLRPDQLDVATMHGRMQIDEFSAEYAWRDGILTFLDADKQARYEVRPGARVAGGR